MTTRKTKEQLLGMLEDFVRRIQQVAQDEKTSSERKKNSWGRIEHLCNEMLTVLEGAKDKNK